LIHILTLVLSGVRRILDRARVPTKSSGFGWRWPRRKKTAFVSQTLGMSASTPWVRGATPLHAFGKNGLDSHLLEREVLASGLATVRLTSTIFYFSESAGHPKIGFSCTASSITGRVASKIAGQKQLARIVLSRAGVSVPKGQRFSVTAKREALQFATKLGWPLVVKPDAGWGGKGVTTNIQNERELLRAIAALDHNSHFIIEEHVAGGDYRFLVLDDRVISVVMRDPANVIGDGQRTIIQLITAKNIIRQKNPHLQRRLIDVNEALGIELKKQHLALTSVPAAGQRVSLSSAGNLSQGGDSCEVLDETHASLKEMAVRALNAVPGLPHAGIDFLIPDHELAVSAQRVAICEINSVPATSGHHFPLRGPSRNVSRELVNFHCRHAGIPLRPPAKALTVRLTVSGRVQNTGYRKWMAEIANPLGIVGWVKNEDDGTVQAILSGPPDSVAIVASLAMIGPKRARVEMVETVHVSDDVGSAFRILRRGPAKTVA
jgi:D-alanine-D-alanine ligase-like ATP-grasp enzyme/acylphosphatase